VADGNSNRLFGAHMLAAEGGEIIQTALAAGSTQGRSLCTVQHSYQRSALHLFHLERNRCAERRNHWLPQVAEIWRTGSVVRSWLLDLILSAWQASKEPLASYDPDSWGPAEADELLARDGRAWLHGCAH
jgi:6-phosphogluconate dehydrogenase (decarboxylating)